MLSARESRRTGAQRQGGEAAFVPRGRMDVVVTRSEEWELRGFAAPERGTKTGAVGAVAGESSYQ